MFRRAEILGFNISKIKDKSGPELKFSWLVCKHAMFGKGCTAIKKIAVAPTVSNTDSSGPAF
jgi:hypothetical protein